MSRQETEARRDTITAGDQTQELIRASFNAFNKGDVQARLATLHEDVRHDINEGGTESGRPAFAQFIERMDQKYRERIVDLVIMANGSRGAAEFTVRGEYIGTDEGLPEATGQRYRIPAAAFFKVENGLITRVTSYYNLISWTEAIS